MEPLVSSDHQIKDEHGVQTLMKKSLWKSGRICFHEPTINTYLFCSTSCFALNQWPHYGICERLSVGPTCVIWSSLCIVILSFSLYEKQSVTKPATYTYICIAGIPCSYWCAWSLYCNWQRQNHKKNKKKSGTVLFCSVLLVCGLLSWWSSEVGGQCECECVCRRAAFSGLRLQVDQ